MSPETTAYTLIFGAILLIGFVIMNAGRKRRATEKARQAYQSALADLKQHPTDPTKKQHALALGRTYSNLTRQSRGVTIFDEMAVMNDLNAATAAAQHGASAAPMSSAAPASVADRLRKLDDLKTQGLISNDEHSARRGKILEDV